MYANWIIESNLVPWLEVLSGVVGYEFDLMDRDAFEGGIVDTDVENNQWFEYELAGSVKLPLSVAQDVGTEVVRVRVACSGDLEARIDTATEVAKEFKLVR
jgi:hypothetical protein